MNEQTSTEVKNMNEETTTDDQIQQNPMKLLRLNKAGILDQARLRPHKTLNRHGYQTEIVNVLLKLKNLGKAESMLQRVSY